MKERSAPPLVLSAIQRRSHVHSLDQQTGTRRSSCSRHAGSRHRRAAVASRPITVMSTWSCRSPASTLSSKATRRPARPRPGGAERPRRIGRRQRPRRPRPVVPRAGERSRDGSSSTGPRPSVQGSARKGQGGERPRRVRRRRSRSSHERLVVDDASKGVKNVLVYFPRPTAVNEDAKKALTGEDRDVRPEEMHLRAARAGDDGRRDRHAQVERSGQP